VPCVLDSLKISSYELMQASTCMYFMRLQVKTCNVQRKPLALLARDPSTFEWSNQHASYKDFAPTELVIRSDRDLAEVFQQPARGTLPGESV
jgi:hypothetical protein